jgi:hypothetical protein
MHLWRLAGAFALLVTTAPTAWSQAVLNGYVREDSTLRGIRDVEVSLGQRSTRTDADGRFAFRDVPVGAQQLQVRRVGYDVVEAALNLVAGAQEQVVYLKRTPTQLDTVVVPAPRPRGMSREGFEERRKLGFGKFIDSVEFRASEHRKVQDMLRTNGIRIATPLACNAKMRPPYCDQNLTKRVAVSASMSHECPMTLVIDGVTVYRPRGAGAVGALAADRGNVEWELTYDISTLMASSFEAAEIYRRAAEIPIEYGGSSSACGVLVLWTRRK